MSKTRIVFVHGAGRYGAWAWPMQHLLAGRYDCLFLKRTGFDALDRPVPTDFAADQQIVLDALGSGGHVVAHAQGAVAAMMAAVARPDLVRSLVLVEPACLSLTAELPAATAYREHLEPVYARREELGPEGFAAECARVVSASIGAVQGASTVGVRADTQHPAVPGTAPGGESAALAAARLYVQAPPWEAPLQIVPGVPTLVLTGGWEPLYEEVAEYLVTTGAIHRTTRGGHRPHDTPEGAAVLSEFLASFA